MEVVIVVVVRSGSSISTSSGNDTTGGCSSNIAGFKYILQCFNHCIYVICILYGSPNEKPLNISSQKRLPLYQRHSF